MRIVLATANANKIREMRVLLREIDPSLEVLSMRDAGFEGDIEENGVTFEENAVIKAKAAAALGYAAVADDSGLEVDALDGMPGVYSARFSGGHGDDRANNEKLLRLMEDVPDGKRTARYVSVIACVIPGEAEPLIARGTCEGVILREYRGDGGFGYDPLFYVPELGKTFAQVTQDEKNAVSHRGKAMRAFAALYRDRCSRTGTEKGNENAEQ